MLKSFKQFMMRGNVIDLAVAVVIGAAFGAVVTALVKDLITPLIAAIIGKPDFSAIVFEVNGSKYKIGDFINVLLSFLLISAAIYFFVVPVNALTARMRRGFPTNANDLLEMECLYIAPRMSRSRKRIGVCGS
jgi:large conductance mechanosensitive channel